MNNEKLNAVRQGKPAVSITPAQFGAMVSARMFRGRKGHGGGPCLKRNLHESEIAGLVENCFESGFREGQRTSASTTINAELLEALEEFITHVSDCEKAWKEAGGEYGTKAHGLAVCLNNRAGDMIRAAVAKARNTTL